jgi:hypothetical protein
VLLGRATTNSARLGNACRRKRRPDATHGDHSCPRVSIGRWIGTWLRVSSAARRARVWKPCARIHTIYRECRVFFEGLHWRRQAGPGQAASPASVRAPRLHIKSQRSVPTFVSETVALEASLVGDRNPLDQVTVTAQFGRKTRKTRQISRFLSARSGPCCRG